MCASRGGLLDCEDETVRMCSNACQVSDKQTLRTRTYVIDTPPTASSETVLHKVARLGDSHIPLAIAHMERGVNPNQKDALGRTPLMFAARFNNQQVLKLLLRAGADPYICTEDGFTALSIAENHGHAKCVEILRAW
jgi:ankyrin repeat protein